MRRARSIEISCYELVLIYLLQLAIWVSSRPRVRRTHPRVVHRACWRMWQAHLWL